MSKTPTYKMRFKPSDKDRSDSTTTDLRDGSIYHWHEDLRLATEVALVTGRPLLLKGEPGGGKSSWAAYVARNLGWRYYDHVVTAKTQAQDLLYQFDLLRRLNDAQIQGKELPGNDHYIVPGMLWWAFDPDGAAKYPVGNPAKLPHEEVNQERDSQHAVLLIDEIDKADPDLPNGLLVPLGSQTFHVPELGEDVKRATKDKDDTGFHRPLVIFSSNSERALPQAFLRRCIVLTLPEPDAATLLAVAQLHDPRTKEGVGSILAVALAARVMALRQEAQDRNERKPGIAEYLDALRACLDLNITLDSKEWELLSRITFKKERSTDDE